MEYRDVPGVRISLSQIIHGGGRFSFSAKSESSEEPKTFTGLLWGMSVKSEPRATTIGLLINEAISII